MRAHRRPLTIWFGALMAVGVLLVLTGFVVGIRRRPVRLTTHVSQFHLRTARLTRSNDERPVYIGAQAIGQIRQFLRSELHLPIQIRRSLSPKEVAKGVNQERPQLRGAPERCLLAISFYLDRPSTSHRAALRLILKDKAGQSLPCGGFWMFDSPNEYVSIWDLDGGRSEAGTYQAEIRDRESLLAQFEVRNLSAVRH